MSLRYPYLKGIFLLRMKKQYFFIISIVTFFENIILSIFVIYLTFRVISSFLCRKKPAKWRAYDIHATHLSLFFSTGFYFSFDLRRNSSILRYQEILHFQISLEM